MSESGRPPREEEVEEEVLERLPRWRRELLRIRDRARSRLRAARAEDGEDEPDG